MTTVLVSIAAAVALSVTAANEPPRTVILEMQK